MRRQPARASVAAWLSATGSLSARLARAHPPFSVRVLQQGSAPAWPGELESLGLPAHTPLLAREVVLCGDGAPLVFARSVTSMQAARGAWRAIQGLGARPLAQLLFSRSEIRRTPLQWQWLTIADPTARAIVRRWAEAAASPLPGRGLWMRHSVFHRAGQALRVAECFLPGLVSAWPAPQRPRCVVRPGPAAPGPRHVRTERSVESVADTTLALNTLDLHGRGSSPSFDKLSRTGRGDTGSSGSTPEDTPR